jgi:hypothetical protein
LLNNNQNVDIKHQNLNQQVNIEFLIELNYLFFRIIVDEQGNIADDWLLARKIHYEQIEEVKKQIFFLINLQVFVSLIVSIYTWSNNSINGKKDNEIIIDVFFLFVLLE